jgi:hypothetical protein
VEQIKYTALFWSVTYQVVGPACGLVHCEVVSLTATFTFLPELGIVRASSERLQPHLSTQRTRRAIERHTPQVRLCLRFKTSTVSLTNAQAHPQPCSPHSAGWVRPSTLRCQTTPSRSTPCARSTDSWPPVLAPPCGFSYVSALEAVAHGLTNAVDVPREEGRPGSAWLEAPMGPLSDGNAGEGDRDGGG